MAAETTRDKILPLWDHISELAARVKVWLYAFVGSTVFYLVVPGDLSFLRNPFQAYHPLIATILLGIRNWLLPSQYTLIGENVTTPLEILAIGAAVFGFATSLPVLAYETYKFVDPAIKPSEKQSIFPFVAAFTVLFLAGALFAFLVLLPFIFYFSLPFFSSVGIATFIDATTFYNEIFFVIIVSGFAFTIPLFFVLLVKMHVLGTKMLSKNRKYVWAITLIITAIASPDGGPLADVALFVPIIILLEGAIWFAKRYEIEGETIPRNSFFSSNTCKYCGGDIDSEGVFCGRCGKSNV